MTPTLDALVKQIVDEMLTIALVAGQYSVEASDSPTAAASAAEAERCREWAGRLMQGVAPIQQPDADDIAWANRELGIAASPVVPQAQGWQAIDTAPSKTAVLIAVPSFDKGPSFVVGSAMLSDDGKWRPSASDCYEQWEEYVYWKPTHWMPLPSPPPSQGTAQPDEPTP